MAQFFQGRSNIPEGILSLALVFFLDELEGDFAEAGCSASIGVLWLVLADENRAGGLLKALVA